MLTRFTFTVGSRHLDLDLEKSFSYCNFVTIVFVSLVPLTQPTCKSNSTEIRFFNEDVRSVLSFITLCSEP